ncbi:MAG: HAMP domain-containing protein, partial [Myxococcota bacterium]|nr:HAMP domain-containing protein [Myxococcota bacterium]
MSAVPRLRAVMSSIEREGPWVVPEQLAISIVCGSVELDLREATLAPVTTIEVGISMGSLEIIVPPHVAVETHQVQTLASSVEDCRRSAPSVTGTRLVLTGTVRLGSCEVVSLEPGESRRDAEQRLRRARHHQRRQRHRQRWQHFHDERDMWMRDREESKRRLPWWLMARMRRKIFVWLALALGIGVMIGLRMHHRPWWWLVIGLVMLSVGSGAIAWKLTRPLIMAVRAARDIGDGKLDTRIDASAHRGEVRMLATAINDMAGKIQQQLSDQRQLLAAVSHELRTPLGHMRVLIETARERNDLTALAELDREVLVLDDLVGKLLASSRLEFGNLDRRPLDLGQLVTDAATTAGVAPEAIEAVGDVAAAVDPTLVGRAIANLLDNARVHGGGAVAVRIERRA